MHRASSSVTANGIWVSRGSMPSRRVSCLALMGGRSPCPDEAISSLSVGSCIPRYLLARVNCGFRSGNDICWNEWQILARPLCKPCLRPIREPRGSNRGLRVLRFDTLAARRGDPCHIREARHPDFPERPPCLTTAFTDDLHKAQQLRFFVCPQTAADRRAGIADGHSRDQCDHHGGSSWSHRRRSYAWSSVSRERLTAHRMTVVSRDTTFFRRAYPEDNEFTTWLGA